MCARWAGRVRARTVGKGGAPAHARARRRRLALALLVRQQRGEQQADGGFFAGLRPQGVASAFVQLVECV